MDPTGQDLLADLTPAQQEAVTHFEGPLLILAAAGSGKTRVITRRVAWLLQQGVRASNILAITFTNKAAREMRERVEKLVPGNRVMIRTFHSFGATILRQYADRFEVDRNFTIYDTDDRNRLVKNALEAGNFDNVSFTPERIGAAISQAKNQLLTPEQYARDHGDFFGRVTAKVYATYQKKLRDSNAMDFDDLLFVPAMTFRKNAELRTDLDARFRFVLIDEYQDTNLAQYEIAHHLSIDQRNLCVVGDPDQCLIPGTMIDTPKGPRRIERIKEGAEVNSATGWNKTGSMPVEKVMTKRYCGRIVEIQTDSGARVIATPNHICFARLRATPTRHFVYLMWKKGIGYRLGTTRGVRTSKDGLLLSGLQVRTNQEVADAVWIIKSCASAAEARFFEHFYSVRYGIPTMVFFVRGRRMMITQDLIDRLYREVDTESAALKLMADFHIDRRFPHHRPGAVVRGSLARRLVHFTVFGDPRPQQVRPWHQHRVQLITSGAELRSELAQDFLVRDGRKATWRIETSRKNYDEGLALSTSICSKGDFELVSRAKLTSGKAFHFLPASHVQPGMIVPVCHNGEIVECEVTSVNWRDYDGIVYDLSVQNTRNYIANGMVVHNSIYRWRGSDIRNILDFEKHYPDARVVMLGNNFRSTKAILHAAGTLIEHNANRKKKPLITDNPTGEPVRLLTFDSGLDEADLVGARIRQAVDEGKWKFRDIAVFVRMNYLTRSLESAFVKHAVPFQIVKGLAFFDRKENKDVLAYLRLIVNPHDNLSFMRAIAEPPRGVGKVSLEHLQNYAEAHDMGLMATCAVAAQLPSIKGKALNGLKAFHKLMTDLRGLIELPPHEIIDAVLERSGYRAMLEETAGDDDVDRVANVDELITAARQFHEEDPARTLGDFLEQITLASDVDGYNESEDRVSVMTLHTSKGLEFPVVYILAIESGILPHARSLESRDDEELEEERRLLFVGMTRAKKELNLCHARVRQIRGVDLYAIPSEFLRELPEDGVEHSDLSRHAGRSPAHDTWRGGNKQMDDEWHDTGVPASGPMVGATTTANAADYFVGQIVQHDSYGIGQVTDLGGFGSLRKMKIRFALHGEKTFVADKVKLKAVPKK